MATRALSEAFEALPHEEQSVRMALAWLANGRRSVIASVNRSVGTQLEATPIESGDHLSVVIALEDATAPCFFLASLSPGRDEVTDVTCVRVFTGKHGARRGRPRGASESAWAHCLSSVHEFLASRGIVRSQLEDVEAR